jgi:protein gp37
MMKWCQYHPLSVPLPNVWLGVSCEDQATADERIPLLVQTPAAVKWVSAEPLLGPIDLTHWLMQADPIRCGLLDDPLARILINQGIRDGQADAIRCLDWLVVGGESGPQARPMNPQWARDIRDQCQAAGVPFFHKQNGEFASVSEVEGIGAHYTFPDGRTVRRVGKKAAGRSLDGRTWDEYPACS